MLLQDEPLEADRIYKKIAGNELIANNRIGSVAFAFESAAEKLGKEKTAFQANEIGDLMEQLQIFYRNEKTKKLFQTSVKFNLGDEERQRLEAYANTALILENSISGVLTGTAAVSVAAEAGLLAADTYVSSGLLESAITAGVGRMGAVSSLAQGEEGGRSANAAGTTGGVLLTSPAVAWGVSMEPVSVVGVFLKRNKNLRTLARAIKDQDRANQIMHQISEKCNLIAEISNQLVLFRRIFSDLRISAATIYHTFQQLMLEFEECDDLGDFSEVEQKIKQISELLILLESFLKNAINVLEFDVLQKESHDIPSVNELFNHSLVQMGELFIKNREKPKHVRRRADNKKFYVATDYSFVNYWFK